MYPQITCSGQVPWIWYQFWSISIICYVAATECLSNQRSCLFSGSWMEECPSMSTYKCGECVNPPDVTSPASPSMTTKVAFLFPAECLGPPTPMLLPTSPLESLCPRVRTSVTGSSLPWCVTTAEKPRDDARDDGWEDPGVTMWNADGAACWLLCDSLRRFWCPLLYTADAACCSSG